MKRSIYYARKPNGEPWTFKHQGREFRLWKRLDHPDAPYYCNFEHTGERHAFSLGTNVREVAAQNARLRIEAVKAGALRRKLGLESPAPLETVRKMTSTLGQF